MREHNAFRGEGFLSDGRAAFFRHVLDHAGVPEHSPAFMQAVSGGDFFALGEYCFLGAEDWLGALAYPLRGEYSHAAFEAALAEALERTGAEDCWCIGPDLPPRLAGHEVDSDDFFALPAAASPPSRLETPLRRARACLRAETGKDFSSGHRRLWAEFTARVPLKAHVRELFARTEEALRVEGTELLSALDGDGHPVACMLLDFAPRRFVSYIIGAHSRSRYVPHASDLLVAALLEEAKKRGKEFIHLGLGVNEGIRRFKRKWGAEPVLPYRMAAWKEKARPASGGAFGGFMRALAASGPAGLSKRQIMAALPEQRPFAMLWETEKNGARSWIGGTAHFFCCSFERSFRNLFREVDLVLVEGPLDEESLNMVARSGRNPPPEAPRVASLLSEREIRALERVVRGPEGFWPRLLNMEAKNPPDVRRLLEGCRPWHALFTLWTAFLERIGWDQSVDLEIWRLGHETGKAVAAMESLSEQIESLENVTAERVAAFFRKAPEWRAYAGRNVRAYLAGDLAGMMGTSTEFPTRTERIINRRDQRFRERMRPFLEAGRCAVFVGSAHMLNLRGMLAEDGFVLRRCRPGRTRA
jgi:uncharacterized protein YbaP (TraB family)